MDPKEMEPVCRTCKGKIPGKDKQHLGALLLCKCTAKMRTNLAFYCFASSATWQQLEESDQALPLAQELANLITQVSSKAAIRVSI